jgi:hypothetical protein
MEGDCIEDECRWIECPLGQQCELDSSDTAQCVGEPIMDLTPPEAEVYMEEEEEEDEVYIEPVGDEILNPLDEEEDDTIARPVQLRDPISEGCQSTPSSPLSPIGLLWLIAFLTLIGRTHSTRIRRT